MSGGFDMSRNCVNVSVSGCDARLGLRHPCVMEFVGIENTYAESGTPEGLLHKYGLTAAHIAEAARRAVRRKE